jgi:hypothetical protein
MIKIEYKEKDYELPTKFSEITLDKYIDIISISSGATNVERLVDMISILSGLDIDEVKGINIDQVSAIGNHLEFMFKSKTQLLVDQIKIGNQWYGFNKNITKISFGEYIDLEEFSAPEKLNKNIHILMAILYRPIKQRKKPSKINNLIKNYIYSRKEDYEIEDYETDDVMERAELFKSKLKVDVVLGAMFFFTIIKLTLIDNSKQSLTQKEMMNKVIYHMKKLGIDFLPIGDG